MSWMNQVQVLRRAVLEVINNVQMIRETLPANVLLLLLVLPIIYTDFPATYLII